MIREKKPGSPSSRKKRKLGSRHIQMLKNILLYGVPTNNHKEHMERFSVNIGNVRRI